eukprot:301764_1
MGNKHTIQSKTKGNKSVKRSGLQWIHLEDGKIQKMCVAPYHKSSDIIREDATVNVSYRIVYKVNDGPTVKVLSERQKYDITVDDDDRFTKAFHMCLKSMRKGEIANFRIIDTKLINVEQLYIDEEESKQSNNNTQIAPDGKETFYKICVHDVKLPKSPGQTHHVKRIQLADEISKISMIKDIKEKASMIRINDDVKEDVHINIMRDIVCNGKSLDHCLCFDRIIPIMKKFNELGSENATQDEFINNVNTVELLDDYLHLMYQHDSDFDIISNKLPNCGAFQRIYRDRTKQETQLFKNQEMLDKIHCYFTHSQDIGHRLSKTDKSVIEDEIKLSNNASKDIIFKSKLLHNFRKISLNKLPITVKQRTSTKSNQLCNTQNNKKMFHFGIGFNYGYEGEDAFESTQVQPYYHCYHDHLKHELIDPDRTAILTAENFNREYKKAQTHIQSQFYRRSFKPYDQYKHGESSDEITENSKFIKTWRFSIDNILAILVYCNYTHFQNEFSKSYRTHSKRNNHHGKYYHLGKHLKIAVHIFGTQMRKGNVKKLYHGISEMLTFPTVGDYLNGVNICCPLSATQAFEVAAYFASCGAQHQNGMIIELAGDSLEINVTKTKYFDVAWLSDFPAEKECLFIQNTGLNKLEIKNIWDLKNDTEYCLILHALRYINLISTWYKITIPINEHLEQIVVAIIQHQLSFVDATYKPFKSLSEYAKDMIFRFFQKNGFFVQFYFEVMKESNWSVLFDELCHSEFDWIRLRRIIQLFPNNEIIRVKNITLNNRMFEDILNDLGDKDVRKKVMKIDIQRTKQPTKWAELKYKRRFRQIGYTIVGNDDVGVLFIERK